MNKNTSKREADSRLLIEDELAAEKGDDGGVTVEEGDFVKEIQSERNENQGRGRARRMAIGLVLVLAIGTCAVGGYLLIGNGAVRKAKVRVNGAADRASGQSEEAQTRQAIEDLNANAAGPGVALADGSVVRPGVLPVVKNVAANGDVPVTELSSESDKNLSTTVKPTAKTGESESIDGEQASESRVTRLVGGRNGERSIRITDEVNPSVDMRTVRNVPHSTGDEQERDSERGEIKLPSFGSMLPVRSLGVVYTLRSGGLTRFELVRDVSGKGWSLPRGTVLVGALRGGEYDRAFVSLVGFIDTESGRFVRVSGDLLGADGGMGIRGKRRTMSSGWSRALSKLGGATLSIASAFAGSVGRRPIVINDAFGGYGGRVASELDGVVVGRDQNSFVEVAAGSSGYMMITELPDSVQGVDALSKLSARDMEKRSNVDRPRKTTGISERELADLIQSGDVEAIKEAMPRMTPQMRRVAETVISGEQAGG